jgi:predicted RNase H-like HicB family nuclease
MSRREVAAMKAGKYRVIIERDADGAWIARVPSVRGCHTYGRTLDQARRRIREALSLWVDDAESAELVDEIRLPARVRTAISRSRAARSQARRERERARAVMKEAAETLVEDVGLGLRDAGELLEISHQRVQQLVKS